MAFAVELDRVSFSYRKLKAVNDLTLRVPAGISYGLLGPNGSGKTTLIRLMVGLLKPQSGSLKVLDQVPDRRLAGLIGYMPQLPSLYLELSVIQNVNFFAQLYGLKDKSERLKRVEETIRLVELWSRRNDSVMNLSGGMKQRVSLACAIVHNPEIIFLDEPTVGLDPELRVSFWDHFTFLTSRGVTLIISSHTMDDAAQCQKLAFMREGRIIAEGAPEELKRATGNKNVSLEEAFIYFIREAKHG